MHPVANYCSKPRKDFRLLNRNAPAFSRSNVYGTSCIGFTFDEHSFTQTQLLSFSPAFLLGVKEFAFLLSQESIVVRTDLGSSLSPMPSEHYDCEELMNLPSFFPGVLRRSYNSGLKDGGEDPMSDCL